jgi:hypothetical protein
MKCDSCEAEVEPYTEIRVKVGDFEKAIVLCRACTYQYAVRNLQTATIFRIASAGFPDLRKAVTDARKQEGLPVLRAGIEN